MKISELAKKYRRSPTDENLKAWKKHENNLAIEVVKNMQKNNIPWFHGCVPDINPYHNSWPFRSK